MDRPLFDPTRLAHRRRRAAAATGDLFLHARAIDGLLDDLAGEPLAAPILLVGVPDGERDRFPADATSAATLADIDAIPGHYGTIILLGELETSGDPAAILGALRHLLAPGGLLAGCIVGGASLTRLRTAMLAADRSAGRASQRVHPFLDGSSFAGLLQSAGFDRPVVALDRVDVAYRALARLVADLRMMGCSSALTPPGPPLTRAQVRVAEAAFLDGQDRVVERFDLIHFAARAPA